MSFDAVFDDADLNGFVDGRIEPARAASLAESLSSDPEARARIDGWKRQNESLRTMFASVLFEPVPIRLLPAALPPRVTEAIPTRPRDPSLSSPRLVGVVATTSIGMALVGFALGALASVGTDGFGLSPRIARGSGVTVMAPERTLAERAVEAHRTFLGDAMRPVELTAAEQPRLLRWIQRRVGSSLRIPDLGRQGWGLIGGRIVPGPRGPAAFLVYGSGTDRLGLTVSQASGSGAGWIGTVAGGDPIGIATWADDDFDYALTTDHDSDWMERNGSALRDSVRLQIRGDGGGQ